MHALSINLCQIFIYTRKHEFLIENMCWDTMTKRGPVVFLLCHGVRFRQDWLYDKEVLCCRLTFVAPVFALDWFKWADGLGFV